MAPTLQFTFSDKMLASSPRSMPVYTATIAARYLEIPTATIRAWFFGMTYGNNKASKFEPIFDPADAVNKLLSFDNLAEAYVYRLMRTQGLQASKIRKALEAVAREFNNEHPLVENRFLTDGIELFVKTVDGAECVSSDKLFFDWYQASLDRVDWEDSIFARFFPITRSVPHTQVEHQPKAILIDPRIAFGATAVASCKVTTKAIGDRYFSGESISELSDDYGCDLLDIEEAVRTEWKFSRGTRAA